MLLIAHAYVALHLNYIFANLFLGAATTLFVYRYVDVFTAIKERSVSSSRAYYRIVLYVWGACGVAFTLTTAGYIFLVASGALVGTTLLALVGAVVGFSIIFSKLWNAKSCSFN